MKVLLIVECDRCKKKIVQERDKDLDDRIVYAVEKDKLVFPHDTGKRRIWLCADCQIKWEAVQDQQRQMMFDFFSGT